MVFRIALKFPPSINTYYRYVNNRVLISRKGREYKEYVTNEVWQSEADLPILGRMSVTIQLHGPTRRKYDIGNRIKSLEDALENAGVFPDDEAIDELHVTRGDVIKGGLCIVQIKELST